MDPTSRHALAVPDSAAQRGGAQRSGAQLAEKIALGYLDEARQGHSRLLFVRYSSHSSWQRLIERLQPRLQQDDSWVVHIDLAQTVAHEAYFPCLGLARDLVLAQGQQAARVCEDGGVYPPQRELLVSYLQRGRPQRAEEPIIDEADYEREQLLRSLQAILAELSRRQPLIILLSNLQAGQRSLWRLLQSMLRTTEAGRILVVAGFASNLPPPDDADSSVWDDMVSSIGEDGVVVALDDGSLAATRTPRPAEATPSLADTLQRCRDAAALLAWEEVICWCEQEAEALQEAASNANPLAAWLLAVLGDAHHHLHAADEALICYEHMLQIAQELADDELLTGAYRRLAIACVNKHDVSTAVRFGQHGIACARRSGDDLLLFQALLALFIVEDKFTRTLDEALYRSLLQLGETYAGPCTRIYMLTMSYLYLNAYNHDFQQLLQLNEQALQLATANHNDFALAVGYHKRSIIHGLLDDHRNSLDCLRQSEALRSRLGNKLEVVRACNGIGYLCLMQDDYRRAWDYFTKAMQLFGSLRDYNEISMTLYNLASLYYRTGQFSLAARILDKVVQIMGILGITHIPFRDIASIYALKGICHFRSGNWIKGTEWLSRIQALGRESGDPETRCYVGILQSHMAALDHDVHRVDALFDSISDGLSSHFKAHARILPWALWEFARLLRQLGYTQNARQRFDEAIQLAREANMRRLAGWIDDDLKQQPRQDVIELPEPDFDLDALVDFARQEVTLKKLRHVVRNMNFLNGLQSLLNRSHQREQLAQDFIRRILGFCPAQLAALYVRGAGGDWQLLAHGGSQPAPAVAVLDWLQDLGSSVWLEQPEAPAGAAPLDCASLINLQQGQPGQVEVNLLLASFDAGNRLERGEKQVLGIALGQLVSVLEKMQHQDKLLYLSTIDELTGLPNRKALSSQLRYELARLARYGERRSTRLSVVFIDLDNFKYYNDNFGHATGDLLLRAIAALLQPCVRDTDFLARYGGDEFVLLLPETEPTQALQLMQRIVDAVGESEQWQHLLTQSLGQPIQIAPEYRLGCSVGIAASGGPELEDDPDRLLQRADQALYMAKKAGKNQVRIWRNPLADNLGTALDCAS